MFQIILILFLQNPIYYLPIILSPSYEDQLLELISLEKNPILMTIAEAHSQDMVDRGFFGHINPDGLDAGDRLDNAGYEWSSWGELIGQGTPQAAFDSWMNSPIHRTLILNPKFSRVGVGYVDNYWTVVLTN